MQVRKCTCMRQLHVKYVVFNLTQPFPPMTTYTGNHTTGIGTHHLITVTRWLTSDLYREQRSQSIHEAVEEGTMILQKMVSSMEDRRSATHVLQFPFHALIQKLSVTGHALRRRQGQT